MYCKICGRPTEGQNTVCNECAAAASGQQNVAYEEPFVLTTPADVKPKKSKKWLYIGLGVVCAIALIVGLLFAFGVFERGEYEGLDDYDEPIITFNTPQEQFDYLARQGFLSIFEEEPAMKYNSSELHVLLGQTVQDLLAVEMEMPAKWLSDIRLTLQYAFSDNGTAMDLGVGLGKTGILSLRGFTEADFSSISIGIPELSDMFLLIDLQSILEESGQELPSTLAVSAGFNTDELQSLLNKYLDIIINGFGEISGSQDTITVNDVSQTCTRLRFSLTEAEFYGIVLDILHQAQNDQQLQELISGFLSSFGEAASGFDFQEVIEEAIARMDQLLASADTTTEAYFDTFVDDRNQVIGCSVDDLLYWKKATADGKIAFAADIMDSLQITGSGTVKNRKESGTYEVSAQGESILSVKVEDVTENKKKGTSSGKITILPGAEIVNAIVQEFSGVGYPADLALEIAWDNTKDAVSGSFKVFVSNELLAGLTVKCFADEVAFDEPTNTVDILNDPNSIKDFLLDLDFDRVIKNMEKAGVPESLTKQLKQITDLLPLYLSQL